MPSGQQGIDSFRVRAAHGWMDAASPHHIGVVKNAQTSRAMTDMPMTCATPGTPSQVTSAHAKHPGCWFGAVRGRTLVESQNMPALPSLRQASSGSTMYLQHHRDDQSCLMCTHAISLVAHSPDEVRQ